MGKEEIGRMKMKRIIYFIIPVLLLILSCEDKNIYDVKFSYQGIIDKEYRFSVGRVIPVTIGQTIETDGDISRDGKYFFYSSNSSGGNFDIYLRSMTDITTVRITSHPSKDITPVISPDGKHLAFVSFRDDPEGDIFVMKIKPGELIKKEEESISSLASMDSLIENITVEREKESQVIINIKDANPSWSPDGDKIVYSSLKGGDTNLWIMKADGSEKKKITEKGGEFPSFSMDGTKIVFVSYRENEHGDVYILDLSSGSESRITSDKNIKLYPSFMNETGRIIYSSIENDTNKNGTLDLQDRSIIRYIDTKNNLTYPLTKNSDSSFKAKWLPVLSTRDYNGIIIYTDITGENINLNIIPETGIIPKKQNAKLQYEMCETYLNEYDDREKYLLSLESVYNYFSGNSDNASRAYSNRALEEAAFYYRKNSDSAETKRIISVIRTRSEKKDLYASFILDTIEKNEDIKGETDISSVSKKFGSEKSSLYYLPFALEDIADAHIRKNNYASALKILNYISSNHTDFERMTDVQVKISLYGDDIRKNGISDAAVKIINTGNTNQKIAVTKNLIEPFTKSSFSSADADGYLGKISVLKTKFKDDKKIMAILCYSAGLLYDIKGSTDKSRDELMQSITLSHPNDITFYLSNIKLGEVERRQSRYVEAEKYFSAGINKYSRRFKTENFKEKLLWLVNYYEQTGEKNSVAGKFKDAAETYDKLINIVTLMQSKRLYPEVYAEYAPKSHILYIDAYTAWKGDASITELEKSYNDKLPLFRMDFNRAAIYGLGYIYTKKALYLNSILAADIQASPAGVYEAFKMADDQNDWALFIDDTFIEPYILKSWIYQYVDLERKLNGADVEKYAAKYFPKHLWEENLVVLEKALNANDEKVNPENEGNLHLNMANNYYLLLNYPRALKSYKLAEKYKKNFGSEVEKALFHFHLGYSLWQNEEIKAADAEIKKAYDIYSSMSHSGGSEKFKYQYLTLYRYFALFSRYEEKYTETIAWDKKILKFAQDNKLTIDRARYHQEIAYCYIKTGKIESAKVNLDRAETLLEKYPDDERKYYLKLKFFGILGPFPVYNMGPDSVVVGNNQIFYPLDTKSKKLLNYSMREEIAVAEGDYPAAIKILKEKVDLLEESSTAVAVETRIRSLNNLGYYAYISGKLGTAEKYFNKAGDLAAEKGNLQGTFSSMMNLVNLYALMIEDDTNAEKDWRKSVTELITKIDSYRKNYYTTRLTEEKLNLDKQAEAKNEKVTDQQIADLSAQIELETSSIYYSLDTATAILKYYLAEILYASDPASGKKDFLKSFDLYTSNKEIFNLYKDALKSFETAMPHADNSGRKELKAKLLLNAASCYERTGEFEKAYVSYLDAKTFGEQNFIPWVKINASHKLGNFLYNHGKEVEKSDSRDLADKNFIAAVSAIEEHPALYSSYSNRIKIIYRDYINFLIDNGNVKRAFELSERYSQAGRIIAISSLSPKFSNEYDRKKYYDYSTALGKLGSVRNELSALLLSGSADVSPEVTSKKKIIAQEEAKLKSLLDDIRNTNSSIRPYVEMSGYKDPSSGNIVFRFHETEKGLYYWRLFKGKLTSGYIKDNAESVFSGDAGNAVFIVLSDTVIKMINTGTLKPSGDFVFINTIDRIPDYLKDSNSIAKNIYSEVKGLSGAVEDGVDVAEGSDKSFADYSLIVDKSGTDNDISPELLFSSAISPACLIQAGVNSDYLYLTSLMEGALYAGTKRVIVTSGTGSDTILPLVKRLYGKPESIPATPLFTLGYINTYSDRKTSEDKQVQDKELSLFTEYMKNADFVKAGVHLARWNSFQKEKNSITYISNRWLLELLNGNVKNAQGLLDAYKPQNSEEVSVLKLRKAYTFFYAGDPVNAENELGTIPETENTRTDINFLKAVLKIVRDGDLAAADIITGIKKPYSTVIPVERYLIPAAEFLYIYKDERALKIAALLPEKPYLTDSEHLMRSIMSGVKPPLGRSIRFDRIAALPGSKDLSAEREEALKLIRGENGIDSLSVYPVLQTALMHEGKDMNDELIQFGSSVNLDQIIAKSDSLMGIMLLKKVDDFYSSGNKFQDRIPVLKSIADISLKNSFNSIIKETVLDMAMNYLLLEDYQNSFDTALSAEEMFVPEDRSYADMQLLRMNLYIRAGKYKEAEIKGELLSKVENLPADRRYLFNLQLSLLELNRLRSLKQASVADAAQFEKHFSSALTLVKKDTELLNRRGYLEITANIFDEFINFKMKTGQHSDAQYYNEVKKLLRASSKCKSNLFRYAGTIDMDAVQKVLPDKGLYVNIAKNKNDLFVWTADRKSKNAFVIENGYESAAKFINDYTTVSASGKDLDSTSRALAKILSPLYEMMKDKTMILISADSFTEKIPFEIAGEGDMVSNKTQLVYMPSLLLSAPEKSTVSAEVYVPEIDNSAAEYLGKVAVKESGVKFSSKGSSGKGFVHLSSEISFNNERREFTVNSKNIKGIVSGNSVLYAPSDGLNGQVTDFLFSGRELNLKAALLNGGLIQDTNNAFFIEEFYRNAAKGVSLTESFKNALNKTRNNNRYSYPSNWSGYRLNIYDLNLLKE